MTREVLSFLVEHAEAQDTMEGIMRWWLLDRNIRYQQLQVTEAITDLVAKGYVLEVRRRDAKKNYRLNKDKSEEIRDFLKNGKSEESN